MLISITTEGYCEPPVGGWKKKKKVRCHTTEREKRWKIKVKNRKRNPD